MYLLCIQNLCFNSLRLPKIHSKFFWHIIPLPFLQQLVRIVHLNSLLSLSATQAGIQWYFKNRSDGF